MAVRTALDALTMRPTRFLRSSWPWRSALYLAGGVLLEGAPAAAAALLYRTGSVRSLPVLLAVAGAPIVAGSLLLSRLQRARLRLVDLAPLDDPHQRVGARRWLRTRLRERATWRELGYALVAAGLLCWMDALVLACTLYWPVSFVVGALVHSWARVWFAVGVVLLTVGAYPITAWAGARAAMTKAILAPRDTDRLGERLVEVTRSRARLVDAFEIERRRIERDLHDGAQQRLVALNMQLGLARLEVPLDSPAGETLAKAHDLADQALTELRELIRGVHPQILTGRGLPAAIEDVAGRSAVPVDVDVRLPGRLPESIEVTAYFAVVEALTNVAKHARASRAVVTVEVIDDVLRLRVRDDGVGGADPGGGSGLVGLVDRLAVVDGTVALSSPAGGPTVLQAEIPVRRTTADVTV